jgi:hypothetical protein
MATSGSPAEEDMSRLVTADAGSQRLVVLVNGLPAAGKTTLARALSRRLSLSLFSKDVIKRYQPMPPGWRAAGMSCMMSFTPSPGPPPKGS